MSHSQPPVLPLPSHTCKTTSGRESGSEWGEESFCVFYRFLFVILVNNPLKALLVSAEFHYVKGLLFSTQYHSTNALSDYDLFSFRKGLSCEVSFLWTTLHPQFFLFLFNTLFFRLYTMFLLVAEEVRDYCN
jgi:hypothetical protein